MFAVFVTLNIKPGALENFLPRMEQQATDSLVNEEPCRIFEVWTSSADPQTVQLYEVYDDAAAFDAHLETPHFKAFDAEIADWVVEKTVQTFDRKR